MSIENLFISECFDNPGRPLDQTPFRLSYLTILSCFFVRKQVSSVKGKVKDTLDAKPSICWPSSLGEKKIISGNVSCAVSLYGKSYSPWQNTRCGQNLPIVPVVLHSDMHVHAARCNSCKWTKFHHLIISSTWAAHVCDHWCQFKEIKESAATQTASLVCE